MKRWEYKRLDAEDMIENDWDALGEWGWEFVTTIVYKDKSNDIFRFIFKREVTHREFNG